MDLQDRRLYATCPAREEKKTRNGPEVRRGSRVLASEEKTFWEIRRVGLCYLAWAKRKGTIAKRVGISCQRTSKNRDSRESRGHWKTLWKVSPTKGMLTCRGENREERTL